MTHIPQYFQIHADSVAATEAIVQIRQVRFTILTSRLIRMEYSPEDCFEDRPSQAFWYRRQPVPLFHYRQDGQELEIETEHLCLRYIIGSQFFADTLSIRLKESGVVWRYGDPDLSNLHGTTRTLDNVDGQINLESGLMSRMGWTLVNDSQSLVFNPDGWLEARPANSESLDLYFFGYVNDYAACLADFCKLAGAVPLVPRWALGNWWSRYWAYTQDELAQLMLDFRDNKVPLSVCIIDMDWHITQTGNACSGWTGYTWNRELFPDPAGFIRFLHSLGLRTALNLHPAEGIHAHEAMYPQMAQAVGIDPASQQPVPFEPTDPQFALAYLEHLHHPQEADGVDFWWMDWQQGNPSRLPGLNLLWWINHLHYYDLGRNGNKRPFLFSRWGGLGNHRYPIGFSGDTVITWGSLAFQPYFTATAANVGYSWWSHDIGGHMNGIEDSELYTRWVQFGVFSPIFRLHSTTNLYLERRPWGHDAETFRITQAAMRLRHSFIPYLYSMAWQNHRQGIPAIRPMYHIAPDCEQAYACPNQYTYGSELIAAPFITPRDRDTNLSRQIIWLPDGNWFGFFDGQHYQGDTYHAIYGKLDDIPVFAKAGAIVPLGPDVDWGGIGNPEKLVLHIFPGADNRFELFEDDGETTAYLRGAYAITSLNLQWKDNQIAFQVEAVQGDVSLIPPLREYTLVFHSIIPPEQVSVEIQGEAPRCSPEYDPETHQLVVSGLRLQPRQALTVTLQTSQLSLAYTAGSTLPVLHKLFRSFRLGTEARKAISLQSDRWIADPAQLAAYQIVLTRSQMRALLEVVTQSGFEHTTNAGEELVILWNNQNTDTFTYLLSTEKNGNPRPEERFLLEQGAVPGFKIFRPGQDFTGRSVVLQVDYENLLRIINTWNTEGPYPRPMAGMY